MCHAPRARAAHSYKFAVASLVPALSYMTLLDGYVLANWLTIVLIAFAGGTVGLLTPSNDAFGCAATPRRPTARARTRNARAHNARTCKQAQRRLGPSRARPRLHLSHVSPTRRALRCRGRSILPTLSEWGLLPPAEPEDSGAGEFGSAAAAPVESARQLRPSPGAARLVSDDDDAETRGALDRLVALTILLFWLCIQLYYANMIVRARKTTWLSIICSYIVKSFHALTCGVCLKKPAAGAYQSLSA